MLHSIMQIMVGKYTFIFYDNLHIILVIHV